MEYLLAQVAGDDAVPLPEETTPVQGFYAGKTLLVTGGTGSVGRLLVPMILKNCPDVHKVYLIVRAKNLNQMGYRQEELLNHPAYCKLIESSPESLSKVTLIRGELSQPNLGITDDDARILAEDVEIVFHLGSTSLFDENFRASAKVNVRATHDLLNLAKRMRKLKVFVHVSTLFANYDKNVLEESFERQFISAKALMEFVDSMDPSVYHPKPINLGGLPTNYIFTKAIAEELIKNESRTLPVVIVRLPLMISSHRYPHRGFTDTVNGLVGLSMTTYIGLNKSILAKKDAAAEVLPMDMAANAMIAIAWDTANSRALNDNVEHPKEDHLLVYNLTTANRNKLRWKHFFRLCHNCSYRYPTSHAIALPWSVLHTSKFWHFTLITFLHYIPGYVIDVFTLYFFYSSKYIGSYTKIDMLSRTLTYFTTKSWSVKDLNIRGLLSRLNEDDKELFNFDVLKIEWQDYFENYILGIRKFVLKDDDRTLPESRRHNLRRMGLLISELVILAVIAYAYLRNFFIRS